MSKPSLLTLGIVLALLVPSLSIAQDTTRLTGPYLGQTLPGMTPTVFAPGFFADGLHSAPAFSPDGNAVYWSQYYVPEGRRSRTQHIFVSRQSGGVWTDPALASFSGQYSDGGPCFTQDGQRLFFYSNRPADSAGQPSDEYVSDIWYVDHTESGWGSPQRLALNSDKHEGMQSVAGDGTIYFQSNRRGVRGIFDIFVGEPGDGSYPSATNIGGGHHVGSDRIRPLHRARRELHRLHVQQPG